MAANLRLVNIGAISASEIVKLRYVFVESVEFHS